MYLEGDRSAPAKWDALVQVSAARMPQAEAGGEALFALAAIENGDWVDAEARIARARSIVREHPFLEEKPGQAITFAVSALCQAHAAADATIDGHRARELLARIKGFEPWDAIVTRCALVRVSLLLGDLGTARTLAAEASALLDTMPGWDELRPRVALVYELIDRAQAASTGMAVPLTSAELRVLRLLPSHLSLGQIAGELFVTRNTIKSQVLAVYRKLEVSSRDEAVEQARRFGLIEQASD